MRYPERAKVLRRDAVTEDEVRALIRQEVRTILQSLQAAADVEDKRYQQSRYTAYEWPDSRRPGLDWAVRNWQREGL